MKQRQEGVAVSYVPVVDISADPSLEPGDTPRYEPVLAGPHLMSGFRKSVTLS